MTRRKLREEDFPLEVEKTSVKTTDGTAVATTETPELARDVAERLNGGCRPPPRRQLVGLRFQDVPVRCDGTGPA